jgi:N,N'-diacetyllegionaminate synthase
MRTVKIGGKLVGDGHPVFISLEAGATHSGLENAKVLCKAASDAGADAVKFQTVRAEDLMVRDDTQIEYENAKGKRSESVQKALKRRELSFDDWRRLKEFCDSLKLAFISTPSGPETVDLLADMGAAAIKVSKSDINHRVLVDYMARKGLPIILDGRERFEDVETAARICEGHGLRDIIIMHCPSGYPAQHAGIHLNAIRHIKEIFQYPVGYSDHSTGTAMNFAAIALGANFLEKTITMDRNTDAVEHFMSLEPHEIKPFIQEVRAVEAALGDPRIIFNSRVKAEHRRSIQARRKLPSGHKITLDDLDFRRPGTHISADQFETTVGRLTAREISAGAFLSPADLQ